MLCSEFLVPFVIEVEVALWMREQSRGRCAVMPVFRSELMGVEKVQGLSARGIARNVNVEPVHGEGDCGKISEQERTRRCELLEALTGIGGLQLEDSGAEAVHKMVESAVLG
eukprot:TRINITY_DN2815_c1_g2_i2.p2 TRINITY_DN2815_c1_g2~~TRINITY_DN2815_c1_g2_i2.p2  ORF type:complete len:112 (-),score=31.98 TRINITY_DN2815_c1_g2_i2:86-421(-)